MVHILKKIAAPNVFVFLEFVFEELSSLWIYINTIIIGLTICLLSGHYSIIPFIVPLIVQIIARSSIKYRQRHVSALVELPAQTDDPAFIMDMGGDIILSIGYTQNLFKKYAIKNVKDFVGKKTLEDIFEMVADRDLTTAHINSVEGYSNVTEKWYEIKAKTAGIPYGQTAQKVLVWFQDISIRREYDLRLKDLLQYSSSLIHSLEEFVRSNNVYDHLASFILKDYQAIFITRADKKNNLKGYVFKQSADGMKKSEAIIIHRESLAPINVSRKKAKIISDDMSYYNSIQSFLQKNPLDPAVLEFIDIPVQNFITYNEADISIIAFNFKSAVTAYEKRYFEILLNIYRTIVMLVDLEKQKAIYQ